MLSIKELPRIIRFLPKIVLAVIVTTCDEVYKKIAYWLNDMGAWGLGAIWGGHSGGAGRGDPPPKTHPLGSAENYRLQSAYEKHLIIKIVLVRGWMGRGGVGGGTDEGPSGRPALTLPSLPPSFSL